jgi:hypothetical protein
MTRARPEQAIQKSVVAYLRRVLPHGWLVVGVSNNPRSAITGAVEKAMGMVAGYPDITVLGVLDDQSFAGFIECKSASGRLSPAQVDVHDRLCDMGFPVAIVRSIEDTRAAIRAWGLPSLEVGE